MILSATSLLLISVYNVVSASGTADNCRVMADCNNSLIWKSLSHETPSPGPKIHHYSQSLTYAMGKSFCHSMGNRLCRSDELCSNGELLFDVIPGDNWVPVLDDYNEWLEIGDDIGRTCYKHGPHYGPPPWGTTTVVRPYKGYVYCCPKESGDTTAKYQYIGKTATYHSSKRHCTHQGMRLCSSSEVCNGNNPVFGTIVGDYWVAVNDKHNEWVEIGNSRGRTCWIHGDQYGPPDWGERSDGSAKAWLGYVYCCSD